MTVTLGETTRVAYRIAGGHGDGAPGRDRADDRGGGEDRDGPCEWMRPDDKRSRAIRHRARALVRPKFAYDANTTVFNLRSTETALIIMRTRVLRPGGVPHNNTRDSLPSATTTDA